MTSLRSAAACRGNNFMIDQDGTGLPAGRPRPSGRRGGGSPRGLPPGVVADARRQRAGEPERGEAVHDRPGGERVAVRSSPAASLGQPATPECSAAPARSRAATSSGVVGPVEVRAEHHLEVRAVADREVDVGDARVEQVAAGAVQRLGQQVEALGGEGGEQPGLVAEVVGRARRARRPPGGPGRAGSAPPGPTPRSPRTAAASRARRRSPWW